jgi:hypothetical protein
MRPIVASARKSGTAGTTAAAVSIPIGNSGVAGDDPETARPDQTAVKTTAATAAILAIA